MSTLALASGNRQWRARRVACLLLWLTLSACGFSLRQAEQDAIDVPAVQLLLPVGSPLGPVLSTRLEQAGVTVLPADASAGPEDLQLRLDNEEFSQRALTASSRARGAEYELRLAVTLHVSRGGQVILGPERLLSERRHNEDTANLAGSAAELQRLQQDMRESLASQLLTVLANLSTPTAP